MGRRTNENRTLTVASWRRRATSLVVATLSLWAATVANVCRASVPSTALEASAVNVGFDGVYKNGFQTRVVAFWKGSVERIELETLDSDGTPFVVAKTPTVDENEAGRAEFSIVLPKANAALTLRCFDANGATAEKTFEPGARSSESATVFAAPASASKPIYLVVGDGEIGLKDAFSTLRWSEARRPTVVQLDSLDEAPTDWRSYEAVERLILTTANPETFAGLGPNDARIVAIERWLERGGDVVLLAGAESIPLIKEGGALFAFSPGEKVADAPHEFRVVNSLLSNLEGVKNLAMTGTKSSPYLRVPVVSELKPNAVVGMLEAETPLFVERPVGLGTVAFFAADLSTPPFSNWMGRGVLWTKILGRAASGGGNVDAPVYVKRGYRDISGQLRSANDVFEGVAAPSFALALILAFVYLLAVGPLDWALAKKAFKRPSTTWATFPAFVILFGALAVWATKATRTSEPRLNQVDLIDVDVESGVVRNVSWFGLYSPQDGRRGLTFAAGDASAFGKDARFVDEPTATLTPLALSGDGVGGAEQQTFAPRVWDAPYSVDANVSATAGLNAVPFLARSSKSFVGRWTGRLAELPRGDLYDDGLALRGTIVNPLDVPIYSAFVLYAGGAYSLGTLAPGETKLERSAIRLETRRVLNEHRSSVPTERAERWNSTDYNAASRRVPYILRAASFYDLGGGSESYGLEKRLQGDVDLSDLIRCGRAVVYGTVVDPEAEKYRPLEEVAKSRPVGAKGKTDAELAVEKYGTFGSSDELKPTVANLTESGDAGSAPSKRTVVVRLVLPLRRGAAPGAER
ncbi:MAG: hypothetical protein IJO40_02370 [Thermoguttaceae bacterium]|nr:hypothetical protein [Thermoguttaceae bacterium]